MTARLYLTLGIWMHVVHALPAQHVARAYNNILKIPALTAGIFKCRFIYLVYTNA